MSSRPLTELLAQAITIESVAVDARTGVPGSLAAWATVLRWLPGDVAAMRARSCLSKRALTAGCTYLTRVGVVEVGSDKRIQLTSAGEAAVVEWRPSDPVGPSSLRDALVSIVSGLELEHPHFPTQYGTADQSITGGPGQDWKPVPRVDTTGLPALPLVALLSQAFGALAIDYERRNGALGWATVFATVPEIPRWGGTMLAGMERHRCIKRNADGRVSLTSYGSAVRKRHEATLASVVGGWRERFGDTLVDELTSGVQAFVDASGVDVADVRHPPTHALFGRHVVA